MKKYIVSVIFATCFMNMQGMMSDLLVRFNSDLAKISKFTIRLEQGDIIQTPNVDAVVNAANKFLAEGAGVCGVLAVKVHSLLQDPSYNWLVKCQTEAGTKQPIRVGEAVLTNFREEMYAKNPQWLNPQTQKKLEEGSWVVIHAVGPDCRSGGSNGGPMKQDEKDQLKNAYQNSIRRAEEYNEKYKNSGNERDLLIHPLITRIAFPFISSAIFNCNNNEAAEIALEAVASYLKEQKGQSSVKEIVFVLYSQKDFDLFKKTAAGLYN